ncbi:uncharacterized protein TM35_000181740, partial [Trypanosoma theileri]
MFVRLRGVVYLLVLLQCCAYVAYASAPATPPKPYDYSRPAYGEEYKRETEEHVAYWKGAIQELKTKMEKERGEVDAALQAFNISKNKYNTTVENAQEKCKAFTKDGNDGTLNRAAIGEKATELRKECALAVNEVVNASEEMVEKAKERVAAAEKFNATVFELYKKSHDYKYFISAVAKKNTRYARDSTDAEKDVDAFRKLKTAAKRAKNSSTRVRDAAIKESEELKKAVGEAREFLEDSTRSPETVVEKVVPVVQRMRRDLGSVDNTTESMEEEHETEEHELGTAENATTAKQQNEPHVLYENIRGDGSMERTVTTNAQTAAEKLKSHNVQTESHSTSTVHINISGFIDGTSSPALAHGSMLLLVL